MDAVEIARSNLEAIRELDIAEKVTGSRVKTDEYAHYREVLLMWE